MGNDLQEPSVEVGRILFRSWEHQWETGENEAPSVALAKRTMPSDVTQPIYEILAQWEQDLLRSSLPFSPYGLRIRPANNDWMTFADGDYHLVEAARRSLPLGQVCQNWDEALPQPPQKQAKFGVVLRAPSSGTQINFVYEVIWRSAIFPETVDIGKLFGQFSPRYREPSRFG
jgi:hypothetical protein